MKHKNIKVGDLLYFNSPIYGDTYRLVIKETKFHYKLYYFNLKDTWLLTKEEFEKMDYILVG